MNTVIWIFCGLINIGIAILHIYIIAVGASAYRYFGAGEWMASQSEQGSFIPALVTGAVTAVFFAFALYNFAGAGFKWLNLPWLFWSLAAIAAIYLLRGMVIVLAPFIEQELTRFDWVSSYISLAIGLLHAAGVYTYYLEKGTA